MGIPLDVYEVTRRFTNDSAGLLTDNERKLLLGLVRARDFRRLASLTSDSSIVIRDAARLRFFMQVEAFFKKNAEFCDPTAARQAAEQSFHRAERLCRITNRRLDYYYAHQDRLDPELRLLIVRSQHFIEKVLGDYSRFLEVLPEHLKVTGGATATLSRRQALPPLKLGRSIDCLPSSVPYLEAMARFCGTGLRVVHTTTNRVEFVPKNWKTDRAIACEPTGTLPFQLAFDSYAKLRLRNFGIDLADQSVNQEHARIGSVDGSLATIDLSMASDTLAFNTVAWLLPQEWFHYLNAHRSPQYRLNGGIHGYAKFSSMGNGATFALETLVFASFVRAAGCRVGTVYGDDITVSTDCVEKLLRLLRFFGFIPNLEKSYLSGPFRESCGKHYFSGEEVTPFYIRENQDWNLPGLAHNVNGLVKAADHSVADTVYEYLWEIVHTNGLPLVPYDFDSTSGVFVTPQLWYELGKHKGVGSYVPMFWGFLLKGKVRRIDDSRSLLLWFLSRNASPNGGVGDENQVVNPLVRSRYNIPAKQFRRGWKSWSIPGRAPSYLYRWVDHRPAL